jgi:signal transduction histidine kinase
MDHGSRAIGAAQAGSLLVVLIGLTILAGWFFGLSDLTNLYLPGPNVKTNAAISMVGAGFANLILISAAGRPGWLRAGRALAVVPMMLGGLTLSQHVVGWDLGIDQLLATEPPGAFGTASPNRMGPPASTAFLLLGAAMLLLERPRPGLRRAGHALAVAATVIPILPLLGYAYGFSQLYGLARYTGIALSMALSLLILGLSVQAGRPRIGLAALLCRADEAGTAARRLLPAAVLLPFALGWVLVGLISANAIDGPFAVAAMALVLIAGLTALTWNTGQQLGASLDARLAAERALSESARSLREADQQKSDFMATLSHELRNPLAPIRFALELLDGPAAAADRARQTIRRQVQHLTRLIDDLLDLTRITRNKLQLQPRPVPVASLLRDATDAAAGEIARGGHRLEVRPPDEPAWILADPDRAVQILVNLLNNAARYTDTGGAIVLGTDVASDHVTLFVRDTGVGIAPEDLGRVFDSFVQVGASPSGGLGLGLALVRGLAELHGGGVEARSDGPGRGAEFRVRLPRTAAPADAEAAEPPVPVGRRRILIVDDNRDAADTLRDLLAASGQRGSCGSPWSACSFPGGALAGSSEKHVASPVTAVLRAPGRAPRSTMPAFIPGGRMRFTSSSRVRYALLPRRCSWRH